MSLPAARVCFWVEGGRKVGAGHVRRAEALADALTARGAECRILASDVAAARTASSGRHPIEPLLGADPLPSFRRLRADIVVVDLPHVREAPQKELRSLGAAGIRRVVFDGAPTVASEAEVLVNMVAGAEDYPAARATTRLLLGPRHAVLCAGLERIRACRRQRTSCEGRVLVGFGGSDVAGLTPRALAALGSLNSQFQVDVLVGALVDAETRAAIDDAAKSLRRCRVYRDVDPLPILAQADVAVLGFGLLFLEAAAVGLPSVLWHPSPAHAAVAERLYARIGEPIACDLGWAAELAGAWESKLLEALERLLGDGAARDMLARAASEAIDGQGAERVAAALMDPSEQRA